MENDTEQQITSSHGEGKMNGDDEGEGWSVSKGMRSTTASRETTSTVKTSHQSLQQISSHSSSEVSGRFMSVTAENDLKAGWLDVTPTGSEESFVDDVFGQARTNPANGSSASYQVLSSEASNSLEADLSNFQTLKLLDDLQAGWLDISSGSPETANTTQWESHSSESQYSSFSSSRASARTAAFSSGWSSGLDFSSNLGKGGELVFANTETQLQQSSPNALTEQRAMETMEVKGYKGLNVSSVGQVSTRASVGSRTSVSSSRSSSSSSSVVMNQIQSTGFQREVSSVSSSNEGNRSMNIHGDGSSESKEEGDENLNIVKLIQGEFSHLSPDAKFHKLIHMNDNEDDDMVSYTVYASDRETVGFSEQSEMAVTSRNVNQVLDTSTTSSKVARLSPSNENTEKARGRLSSSYTKHSTQSSSGYHQTSEVQSNAYRSISSSSTSSIGYFSEDSATSNTAIDTTNISSNNTLLSQSKLSPETHQSTSSFQSHGMASSHQSYDITDGSTVMSSRALEHQSRDSLLSSDAGSQNTRNSFFSSTPIKSKLTVRQGVGKSESKDGHQASGISLPSESNVNVSHQTQSGQETLLTSAQASESQTGDSQHFSTVVGLEGSGSDVTDSQVDGQTPEVEITQMPKEELVELFEGHVANREHHYEHDESEEEYEERFIEESFVIEDNSLRQVSYLEESIYIANEGSSEDNAEDEDGDNTPNPTEPSTEDRLMVNKDQSSTVNVEDKESVHLHTDTLFFKSSVVREDEDEETTENDPSTEDRLMVQTEDSSTVNVDDAEPVHVQTDTFLFGSSVTVEDEDEDEDDQTDHLRTHQSSEDRLVLHTDDSSTVDVQEPDSLHIHTDTFLFQSSVTREDEDDVEDNDNARPDPSTEDRLVVQTEDSPVVDANGAEPTHVHTDTFFFKSSVVREDEDDEENNEEEEDLFSMLPSCDRSEEFVGALTPIETIERPKQGSNFYATKTVSVETSVVVSRTDVQQTDSSTDYVQSTEEVTRLTTENSGDAIDVSESTVDITNLKVFDSNVIIYEDNEDSKRPEAKADDDVDIVSNTREGIMDFKVFDSNVIIDDDDDEPVIAVTGAGPGDTTETSHSQTKEHITDFKVFDSNVIVHDDDDNSQIPDTDTGPSQKVGSYDSETRVDVMDFKVFDSNVVIHDSDDTSKASNIETDSNVKLDIINFNMTDSNVIADDNDEASKAPEPTPEAASDFVPVKLKKKREKKKKRKKVEDIPTEPVPQTEDVTQPDTSPHVEPGRKIERSESFIIDLGASDSFVFERQDSSRRTSITIVEGEVRQLSSIDHVETKNIVEDPETVQTDEHTIHFTYGASNISEEDNQKTEDTSIVVLSTPEVEETKGEDSANDVKMLTATGGDDDSARSPVPKKDRKKNKKKDRKKKKQESKVLVVPDDETETATKSSSIVDLVTDWKEEENVETHVDVMFFKDTSGRAADDGDVVVDYTIGEDGNHFVDRREEIIESPPLVTVVGDVPVPVWLGYTSNEEADPLLFNGGYTSGTDVVLTASGGDGENDDDALGGFVAFGSGVDNGKDGDGDVFRSDSVTTNIVVASSVDDDQDGGYLGSGTAFASSGETPLVQTDTWMFETTKSVEEAKVVTTVRDIPGPAAAVVTSYRSYRALLVRVLRSALLIHLLLLLLFLLLLLLFPVCEDEYSCLLKNNFRDSFSPMLTYTDGAPPI